jgi:hypothetical protein
MAIDEIVRRGGPAHACAPGHDALGETAGAHDRLLARAIERRRDRLGPVLPPGSCRVPQAGA